MFLDWVVRPLRRTWKRFKRWRWGGMARKFPRSELYGGFRYEVAYDDESEELRLVYYKPGEANALQWPDGALYQRVTADAEEDRFSFKIDTVNAIFIVVFPWNEELWEVRSANGMSWTTPLDLGAGE